MSKSFSLDPTMRGSSGLSTLSQSILLPATFNTSELTQSCIQFLNSFQFPILEILVTFQIVLPVIYSFAVPCMLVFFIECIYRKYEEHQMVQIRKKVSSVLIGSWVHWYFHWELWSMFWISLAFTYLSECPVNARYYEFTVGMSVVSVTICSISNLLSDYRLSIPYDCKRIIFNIACFFLLSWPLRIIYPCVFNLHLPTSQQDSEFPESEIDVEQQSVSSGPPDYSEALSHQAPPPNYNETINRIKRQLPILSRSISDTAQRVGRKFSFKHGGNSVGISAGGGATSGDFITTSGSRSNRIPGVKQSFSMVEPRRDRRQHHHERHHSTPGSVVTSGYICTSGDNNRILKEVKPSLSMVEQRQQIHADHHSTPGSVITSGYISTSGDRIPGVKQSMSMVE